MKIVTAAVLTTVSLLIAGAGVSAETEAPAKAEAKPAVQQESAAEMKVSAIPGITTPDLTPNACVDCHKNHPERNMDFRLTNILAKWRTGSDSDIVKKAQAGVSRRLTGKHPDVTTKVKTIPDDCLVCHSAASKSAPPFKKMLHAIHLAGGRENNFLAFASGNCTSCHKLDQTTGAWRNGSGQEQ